MLVPLRQVLAREYGDKSYRRAHRLTVDAYAVQHPGVPERRSIRSAAVHLVRLCLVFERGLEPSRGVHVPPEALRRLPELRWLEPPGPNGRLTIADVHRAGSAGEHVAAAEARARDVWEAWGEHHATVRGWVDHGLGRAPG